MTGRPPAYVFVLITAQLLMFVTIAGIFLAFHKNVLSGCERGAKDRLDNARVARTAQKARDASFAREHQASDLAAAIEYTIAARSLESRTRPTAAERTRLCHDRFPILR